MDESVGRLRLRRRQHPRICLQDLHAARRRLDSVANARTGRENSRRYVMQNLKYLKHSKQEVWTPTLHMRQELRRQENGENGVSRTANANEHGDKAIDCIRSSHTSWISQ
jgi:uncharacterized membrane protein